MYCSFLLAGPIQLCIICYELTYVNSSLTRKPCKNNRIKNLFAHTVDSKTLVIVRAKIISSLLTIKTLLSNCLTVLKLNVANFFVSAEFRRKCQSSERKNSSMSSTYFLVSYFKSLKT